MKKLFISFILVLSLFSLVSCSDNDDEPRDKYYVEYNLRINYLNRMNRGWDIVKKISYTTPEGQQSITTKDCSYSIKAGPFEKGELIRFTLSDTSAPATVTGTISVSINNGPFVEKEHFEGERSFYMSYYIR